MIRLTRPYFNTDYALNKVIEGIISDTVLRQRVINELDIFNFWSLQYADRLEGSELYGFEANQHVFTELTIENIKKLYPSYFAKDKKPARGIYDAIKNEASGACPFCGGLGFPENLDHYLPKRQFSQFSLLPLNLVPACRDCNMGAKGQAYAVNAEEQTIHPYERTPHFFDDQWIYARYETTQGDETSAFIYYVKPPENWSDSDKNRVRFHFDTFDIGRKYAVRAAQELPFIFSQIQALSRKGASYNDIKESLFLPVINSSPFLNQWKRCMYEALYEHDFS